VINVDRLMSISYIV